MKIIKRGLLLFTIIILIVLGTFGCSSRNEIRNQVVDYLSKSNAIQNDLDDAYNAIYAPNPTYTDGVLVNDEETLKYKVAVNQRVTILQLQLSHLNDLNPPKIEIVQAHYDSSKALLSSGITMLNRMLFIMGTSTSEAEINGKINGLDPESAERQGIALWRLTEQIMSEYKITDNEVNYKYRGVR
jgi:hypothetical protein